MTQMTSDRIRKSVKLSPDQYRDLVKWSKAQPTKIDAAAEIGITRQALDTILIRKSCSPESMEKIVKVLRQDAGTDSQS